MTNSTTKEEALDKLLNTNHPYPEGIHLSALSRFAGGLRRWQHKIKNEVLEDGVDIKAELQWWEEAKVSILKRFPKAQLPHRPNQVWGYGFVSRRARLSGASGIWWDLDKWDTVVIPNPKGNSAADITEPMVKHSPKNFIDR